MRPICLLPLLALALAACERGSGPIAEMPTPTPSSLPATRSASGAPHASTAIIDPTALIGEYRVAGTGGGEIDLPHGITARISEDRIEVTSDCVNLAWSWRFEAGRLATERVPAEGCARGLLREEEAIVAAFDGATRVGRTPANGIEFAGESGSVLLFSQ